MGAVHYSDAESDIIRRHFEAGLSASQIASALYRETKIWHSRNAIVGKLWRLGMRRGFRAKPPVPHYRAAEKRMRVAKARRKSRRRSDSKPQPPTIMLVDPGADIPLDQRKSLGELTNETCRWGFNDPCRADFFFCGAPEADLARHRPYCAFHMARAFDSAFDQSIVPF